IHGRYETPLRSALEQAPVGRLLVGLATYPRIVFDLAYRGAAQPMWDGAVAMREGQFSVGSRKFWEGFKSLLLLYAGSHLAAWLFWKVAGRRAYNLLSTLLRYTPFSPGVDEIAELFAAVRDIEIRAEEQGWASERTASAIVRLGGNTLELLIPISDMWLGVYEDANDEAGVRLWRQIRKLAMQDYERRHGRPFKAYDRTVVEKIQRVVFGGAKYPPKGESSSRRPPARKGRPPSLRRSEQRVGY
ncbi:hypothetical protein ACFL09_04795, partial [Planctomycetota bacterium]